MVPDKIERLCLRAQQAIAERDWEKAKQVYLMALGLRSDLPDVHYGLATVYFQLRELTSAAHHFREVTRLDPLRAGAWVNLGAVNNLLGQLDEAITALRRGIQIDGQRVEGYYNLGLVYRRKGQNDLSLAAYREALRLNPRMPDAHLNIGNLFLEKDQVKMALEHYKQALQLRPNWDKALAAVDTAQQALAGETVEAARNAEEESAVQPIPTAVSSGKGMDQMVDPVVHATFLSTLHQATIVAEDTGRLMHTIIGEEIEPVVAELARVLLNARGPRSELDACITKFETALNRMRTAHQALRGSVRKVEEMGEKLPVK
jgi:tetratricopeptide (TPR) repeat protein